MQKLTKEVFLFLLSLLPLLYLWTIWHQLPETVPTHFNIKGEADDWSSRASLILIPGLLGPVLYAIMLAVPALDSKKKLQEMGEKFFIIRLITALFISAISIY